jgi:hypothetical protein
MALKCPVLNEREVMETSDVVGWRHRNWRGFEVVMGCYRFG